MGVDQLGQDLLGVASEVDQRRPLVDGGDQREQREHMGQRQVQVGHVAGFDELELRDHPADGHRVCVGQHHALGRAGCPRRVDDRVRVLGADLVLAIGQLAAVAAAPAFAQIVEAESAGAGLDPDHVRELRKRAANLFDLRHLAFVLAEDRVCAGVARNPFALARGVGGVHGHRDCPGGRDPEVGHRPFDARVGQQAHPVADLDAEIDQPQRDLLDRLDELPVGELAPLIALLEASGDVRTKAGGRRARQRRNR